MAPIVRQISVSAVFDGVELPDVLGARGELIADGGWPNCSVFVTQKPGLAAEGQERPLVVTAGAGNNVVRFTGNVRRFRPNGFPKSVEIVAMGTLAYADEWAPSEDIVFVEQFPGGATDEQLVAWALDHVPGITYVGGDLNGTGIALGQSAPESFDWNAGQTAWNYITKLDRATLYRTYQSATGVIRRVQMIGHPNLTPDFTLTPADVLDGASATRDTQRTRNYVKVLGHSYPNDQAQGEAWGANPFQGPGDVAATRHAEEFQSDLIENGLDEDGGSLGETGLDAMVIAAQILPDVNKQFVEANVPSWRDDTHEPGLTCLLDCLDRLQVGEPMWTVRYAWEVGEDGWQATYGLTGGGVAPTRRL